MGIGTAVLYRTQGRRKALFCMMSSWGYNRTVVGRMQTSALTSGRTGRFLGESSCRRQPDSGNPTVRDEKRALRKRELLVEIGTHRTTERVRIGHSPPKAARAVVLLDSRCLTKLLFCPPRPRRRGRKPAQHFQGLAITHRIEIRRQTFLQFFYPRALLTIFTQCPDNPLHGTPRASVACHAEVRRKRR